MSHETVPVREEIARPASDPPGAIFARFLKFGALAWGGPAAQIAMIKRECVDELHWVDEETFKKTLAVYQVLPGPEAVCGRQFAAGVAGIRRPGRLDLRQFTRVLARGGVGVAKPGRLSRPKGPTRSASRLPTAASPPLTRRYPSSRTASLQGHRHTSNRRAAVAPLAPIDRARPCVRVPGGSMVAGAANVCSLVSARRQKRPPA